MIDDEFLFSQIDKAYDAKHKPTVHESDEEEVGNRYANEPRVNESDEEDYQPLKQARPYDNDVGAMRLLNQL